MIKYLFLKYCYGVCTIIHYVVPKKINKTIWNIFNYVDINILPKKANKISLLKASDGLVISINNEIVVIDNNFRVVMSSPKINIISNF